jgi:hypothetical protein
LVPFRKIDLKQRHKEENQAAEKNPDRIQERLILEWFTRNCGIACFASFLESLRSLR